MLKLFLIADPFRSAIFLFMKNLLLILLLFTTNSFSQNIEYAGFVLADSVYMDIHLELSHINDSVYGITTMNKNSPIESKSNIRGVFNVKLNTYLIQEVNVINNESFNDSISFCLMDMTLKKNKKKTVWNICRKL